MAVQTWKLITKSVVRQSWPWIIPFALFFSAGCWWAPIRYIIRPQPHEYSVAIVIGQYIGLFAALLLGEWYRNALPQHGRWMWAACGLLGVGWAGLIFDLMVEGSPHIYWYCTAFQILWLLRVIGHRPNALERDLLVHRRRTSAACSVLLGPRFVNMHRFLGAATGLLFCVSCVLVGWTAIYVPVVLRQLSPGTAEDTVHTMRAVAASAGLSLWLATLVGILAMIVTNAEDILLTAPASTKRSLAAILLPPYLAAFLLLLLAVMGGIATGSIMFVAVILGTFLLWTAGCLAIGVYCRKAQARLQSQGLPEAIDATTDPDVRAAMDHISANVSQRVQSTEQGVQVGNIGGHQVIPWNQIRFLLPLQAMRLLIIDSDGNETMCLRTAGPRGTPDVMEQLLSAWGRQVPILSDRVLCEYGPMWQERDRKAAEAEPIAVLVLGLLLIIVGIFLPFLSEKELDPLFSLLSVGFIVAVGLALVAGAFRMNKRPSRIMTSAIVEPGRATFTWTNGPDTVLQKGDIRKCRYNGPESGFSMHLCNGHVINHLERLSNFGLVYRCLLELIPGSTQTKSNDQST